MDQSLVHTFSWGNSYGPIVLKVLQKFPPTLALVHGWLFPAFVRIHSGNNSKIIFLCICICYEIQRILAVWILAAKLPNSDLDFAVDF